MNEGVGTKPEEYETTLAERSFLIVSTGNEASDETYRRLLDTVLAAGLFKRTYLPYALCAALAFGGLVLSFYFMTLSEGIGWQFLNGIFFGFWSIQLGMVGHDLSHNQVFQSPKVNRPLAIFGWCFFSGLSEHRWYEKHNAHHRGPNHEGHDPDLDIPFIHHYEQVSGRSHFFKKYILPYQHVLFWAVLPFVYFYNIFYSLTHLFKDINSRTYIEVTLMVMHFAVLFSLAFWLLPLVPAIIFLAGTFVSAGLYMSLVFAPNHKGVEVIAAHEKFNCLNQITSTRNIYPGPLTSYLLGGLDTQIEHHLFPTMPRYQYSKARKIVKVFCKENNISYYETNWLRSMYEIHQSLKSSRHSTG